MSTVSEDVLDELLKVEGENAPAPLVGPGLSGTRRHIAQKEARDRREYVATMISQGVSRDKIYQVMGAPTRPDGSPGFLMSESATKALIVEVYKMWSEEDAEDRPHSKSAAIRRIKRNIQAAKAKNAWTAVAQMERTLMMIEGTAEPIEINVNGLERLSGAVVNVLNIQSPEQLKRLIDEERALLAGHDAAPTVRSHVEYVAEANGVVVFDEENEDERASDDESE